MRPKGYYKVKKSTIEHHIQHFYEFKPLQAICEEFSKLTNTLKRENKNSMIHIFG